MSESEIPFAVELRAEVRRIALAHQAPDRTEASRGRWRGWRRWLGLRRRRLAIAIAVLLIGGTAAAAVLSLTPSLPLSGTIISESTGGPLPAGEVPPGTVPYRSALPPGAVRYQITAIPWLTVGFAGWCTDLTFYDRRGQTNANYGCGPIESSKDPGIGGTYEARGVNSYEYHIFTREVAAVRFSTGQTFRPVGGQHQPAGMWGVFVMFRPTKASPYGRPPTETLLDAHGHTITQPQITNRNAVEHLPLTRVNPSHPGDLACAVSVASTSGITPIAETVSTVKPWPRPQPGSFESCSNATFRIAGAVLATAVLVNATNPDKPAPALPELHADGQRSGLLTGNDLGTIGYPNGHGVGESGFETFLPPPYAIPTGGGDGGPQPGSPAQIMSLANRDVTARRAGFAWLIAQGGTAAQRAALLAAATVAPVGRS